MVEVYKRYEESITPAGVGRPDYSASLVVTGGNSISIDLVDVIDVVPPSSIVDVPIYRYKYLNVNETGVVPNGVYDTWTYLQASHLSNQLFGAYLIYVDRATGKYYSYMGGIGYGTVTVNVVNDTKLLKPGDFVVLRIQNIYDYSLDQVIFNLSGKRSIVSTSLEDIRRYGSV